jgi:hypothetical protein
MKPSVPALILALASTTATALAGLTAGGAAFTKRVETALLAEPKLAAETVARLPYAREVKVQEVRGPWVRVSAGKTNGWVFAGNLAEAKPSETRGLDGLPLEAADTSATAAARPLAPTAVDYAERKGLGQAAEDIKWLEQQSDALTDADVQAFLQQQKKGEYQ